MKFGELSIVDFLPISKAEIDLDARGLVLIQGINGDDTSASSNGAGKSSIADALSWCLYGETARGISGDDVIRVGAKSCSVIVDVKNADGSYWTIGRYRKDKRHKNKLVVEQTDTVGTVTDHTKGTDKLTQVVVNDILGCSLDVFKAAIYSGQEQMPDLPGMTDKMLKMLVEEAAGVNTLERAYQLAQLEKNAVRQKLEVLEAKVKSTKMKIAGNEELIQDIKRDIEGHKLDQKRRILEQQENIVKNVDRIGDLKQAMKDIDAPKVLAEIDRVVNEIDAVGAEQVELRRQDKIVSEAKTQAMLRRNEVDAQTQAVRRLKHAAEHADDLVGQSCGECGKIHTADDTKDTKELATKRLREGAIALREFMSACGVAEKSLVSVTSARDAFAASMTDVSAKVAQRSSLQAKITKFDALRASKKSLERVCKLAADRLVEIKAEDPYSKQLRDREIGGKNLEDQLKLDEDARDAGVIALEEAELVAKVFSPAGVRAHILDTVTPFLNDRTAKYLSILSDGNIVATWSTLIKNGKGELREKFSIEVSKARAGGSFAAISGGEKRKVRLACAMALQDMVASRATKPIELFIADEIDDALDTPGLERLMMILEEKAKERGTLLVISHNNLKDWISSTITVERKAGDAFSTITEQAA